MQIKISLQIFLFIIIFILTHQIEIYVYLMLFAFIHELGHMFAGIILKLKPKALNIMPFGVSISFEVYGYKKLIEIKKLLIALAGPITNILISIIVLILNINFETKQIIIYSNILIAIFNLIPLYPLDGGRILKSLIRINCSKVKTEQIVNKISNIIMIILTIISSITIIYYKNIAIFFIILYLWILTINENKKFSLKMKAHKILQKEGNVLTFNNLSVK